jgi:hypothetical protein
MPPALDRTAAPLALLTCQHRGRESASARHCRCPQTSPTLDLHYHCSTILPSRGDTTERRHGHCCAVDPCFAARDPVFGKHDQGVGHGLGRHAGSFPHWVGAVAGRDWLLSRDWLSASLALCSRCVCTQGSSNRSQHKLLDRVQRRWCACNLHVFQAQHTTRIQGIAARQK